MGHRIRQALIVIGMVSGVLLTAGPAWSHNSMVDSTPAKNETLAKLPAQVQLTFLATLRAEGTSLSVTGPDGASAVGEPQVSGKAVTAPFTGSSPGEYTVEYEVVSADGHVVKGSYRFTLRVQAPSPTPSASPGPAQEVSAAPTGSPSAAAAPTAAADDQGSPWLRWVGGAAVLGLIVGALISWWRQRRRSR